MAIRTGSLLFGVLLLSAAPSVAGAAPAQTIQIEMSNYRFTPNMVQLHANTAYQLRLTNTAQGGHDFNAPQLFAASTIAADDQSKVVDGEVDVEPGQTVEVNFTPTQTGTYKFHCTHFLHSAFGMHGEAVVQ